MKQPLTSTLTLLTCSLFSLPAYSSVATTPCHLATTPWLRLIVIATIFTLAILSVIWITFLRKQVTNKSLALKKSTERYKIIFNSISDAIVIHDAATGNILDINETMLDMTGYTRDEALHSLGILTQNKAPYSTKEAQRYIQKATQGEDQLFEWKIWRKDGTSFWCEVALKAHVINDQKVIIAVARDIEDRKKQADQLLHSHRMEAIGSLASGIAHDFNNILTGIFGYTELAILSKTDPQKLDEYLEEIYISGQRAKKLISQIQTFSKKHKSQKKPIQVASVVNEVLTLLKSSLPSTINITQNLQSTALIHADPTQLHQIILNLCTNSSHAMEDNKGTLSINLEDIVFNSSQIVGKHRLEAGKYIKLAITDTGHGIDPEITKHIFDPYFTTKAQGKGTGLGLAMVQGIVDSHGGAIEVQSQRDQGTTFTIYLPEIEPQEMPHDESNALPQPQENLVGGNETIMMIDDEAAIISSLSTILRRFGYTVHTFTEPTQALAAFSQNPEMYDLILTDMTMPKLTGAELTKQIHQKRPDIPIIITTGNTDTINRENAASLGISDYCAKPTSMQTLLTSVRQALDA